MRLDFIKEQMDWVDGLTSNLMSTMTEADFGVVDEVGTSLNWQMGHIIICKYHHALQSVLTESDPILQNINRSFPVDLFFKFYFIGSDPSAHWDARPDKVQLVKLKEEIDVTTHETLKKLSEENLSEPTEVKNMVAKTKYDALTFSFKHQMWHCGQIAMIKRIMANKISH